MTISVAPSVSTPALAGWRTITTALGCALLIGGIGGLIGLGGGEFRLPLLVTLIGFTARAAVPMNQLLSLITLMTALIVRWHTGSLVGVGAFAPVVVALAIGGITAAWFAVRLLARVSDHRLERAIALLLIGIGALLIFERFLPAGLPALVPAAPDVQIVAGIILGLCIGTASTFLGVAGGELLIPTLIFVFGADIHIAGSAVLFVSIPTVCMGLFRYGRLGLLPSRSTLLRIGAPLGVESLIGASAGGAFAGSASAELLKLLLGLILVTAAFKAFWRHSPRSKHSGATFASHKMGEFLPGSLRNR
ncbi:MAG: sulfite exporter TauE/SafE family protein [Alphaproteobacteria bacterium]|nr:sulfite exporter TauE/SafE family protein [Alphaproteobacteria bacterium]